MEKHGYVWLNGDESAKGQFSIDGDVVTTVKKHSALGQHGSDKDKSSTVLNINVNCANVPRADLLTGFVEWWIINRFRRNSGILTTERNQAIKDWDGKTLDPTVDCLPSETREKLSDDQKVLRIAGKMTVEERRKVIAELTGKMTAEERRKMIAELTAMDK